MCGERFKKVWRVIGTGFGTGKGSLACKQKELSEIMFLGVGMHPLRAVSKIKKKGPRIGDGCFAYSKKEFGEEGKSKPKQLNQKAPHKPTNHKKGGGETTGQKFFWVVLRLEPPGAPRWGVQ